MINGKYSYASLSFGEKPRVGQVLIFLLIISQFSSLIASNKDSLNFFSPSPDYNKKRLTTVIVTESALYGISITGLNVLWYKDYPRSSFHFFNDNREWLQMDKVGHTVTSYSIGRIGLNLMKWSGMEGRKAAWYGGLVGSVYQSSIEILDGFSSQWGFSWGDFVGNTFGSVLVVGQELLWREQRISMKFSFHQTDFAPIRPDLLGRKLQESILKDYNGQTYWLSFNISSFIKKENHFPKWMNLSFGYGANGLIGGNFNPPTDKNGNPYPIYDRTRQYYLALDADLTRIKTRSKFLKAFFETFSFIKIPAPTIGFGKQGIKINALYF